MKIARVLWLAALPLATTPAFSAEPDVQAYLDARDAFIREFEANPEANQDAAREALRERMQAIIGPVSVEGFPQPGEINLESLSSEYLGFEMLDGLRFRNDREVLVVTTRGLVDAYLHREQADLAVLAGDEDFNTSVFSGDARVANYAEVPVTSIDGSVARAHLGILRQDFGPMPPEWLFVLATKGNRLLMASALTAEKLPAIAQCGGGREEDDLAFRQCYGDEIRKRPAFAGLTRQAQSIVDRLQK